MAAERDNGNAVTSTDGVHNATEHNNEPGFAQNLADFASVFKSYVGIAIVEMAFDFRQSGIVLGLVSLIIIASMSDYCGHLLLKCKREVIRRLCQDHRHVPSEIHLDSTGKSHTVEDGVSAEKETSERFERALTYGDIGYLCLGTAGRVLVDAGLCIMQISFCTSYVSFLVLTGVAFVSSLKVGNTSTATGHVSGIDLELNISESGYDWSLNGHFYVLYDHTKEGDIKFHNESHQLESESPETPFNRDRSGLPQNVSETIRIIETFEGRQESNEIESTDPGQSKVLESTATSPYLMYFLTFTVFLLASLVRNARSFGPISLVGTGAMSLALLAIAIYIFADFQIYEDVVAFRWTTLPVVWGHMTASYEGIGMLLPLEASMHNNRHRLSLFLHLVIVLESGIFIFFGIIGYLRFGDHVHQTLTSNLPYNDALVYGVNAACCLGILCTYPLQLFPVIQICEGLLFAPGGVFGPRKSSEVDVEESEDTPLSGAKNKVADGQKEDRYRNLHGRGLIPDSVATWKRNVLRVGAVLVTFVFAVIFKENLAYTIGLPGAVAGMLLAFILPCVFHLVLNWRQLKLTIIIKDVAIIVISVISGIASFITVIQQMIT
ncbi:uncharacterized protein [Ptychodera flava]|uniref:uncharacterized protein n=1 Tax=Ptychodera flava TaxID=63121 RepID=UPI00396A4846